MTAARVVGPARAGMAQGGKSRTTLSRYGLPGDRDAFEQALAAALDASPIGDLTAVAEVIATDRHRLVLRTTPEAPRQPHAPPRHRHQPS
ncbi:hypothetical protein ACIOJE_40655 [Kitasatospora sp. NPDC087861]|uniref:hypothetical protein n=1 Tax=Kitasatospora sp. NPDC087861 TaxID=3364070 RepID=UPI00381A61A8